MPIFLFASVCQSTSSSTDLLVPHSGACHPSASVGHFLHLQNFETRSQRPCIVSSLPPRTSEMRQLGTASSMPLLRCRITSGREG